LSGTGAGQKKAKTPEMSDATHFLQTAYDPDAELLRDKLSVYVDGQRLDGNRATQTPETAYASGQAVRERARHAVGFMVLYVSPFASPRPAGEGRVRAASFPSPCGRGQGEGCLPLFYLYITTEAAE